MVKIKICGLKRLEDIEIVNKYKPDFIGFVFAESPRKVNHDLAKQLKDNLNFDIKEKIRSDGRRMDEIRPLSTDIDLLPRTHGSAMFTRGQTQIMSVATLAGPGMAQELDGVDPETKKTFMHKYIFPGAIQYFGPSEVADITTQTLKLEHEAKLSAV